MNVWERILRCICSAEVLMSSYDSPNHTASHRLITVGNKSLNSPREDLNENISLYLYFCFTVLPAWFTFLNNKRLLTSPPEDQADSFSVPLLRPWASPLEHLVGNEPISPNNGVGCRV